MLVVYVDDFKLAGPRDNLAKGWELLRKHISIEQEVKLDGKGATYLGCRQVKSSRRLPHGGLATVMEYDMEEFLSSCLEKFKELAHVKDIRPFPTPFITEEQTNAPQGQAGTGPCVECPWCKHTFPPNVHETVNALERDIQQQKAKLKNLESPSKDSSGNAESSSSRGSHPAESTGKLASIASRILMKVLWAARLARFDLLRAVCHLAQNVTKWTS